MRTSGNAAGLNASCIIFFLVIDRNISRIERIGNAALIHPSDDAADHVVAIVDGARIVGFFHGAGETAHDAAHVSGIIRKRLITNLAFVVHIIKQCRGVRSFRRIADDTSHIDAIITSRPKRCSISRRIYSAQIVGTGNLAIIHHTGDTADAHVAAHIACAIAVRHRSLRYIAFDCVYIFCLVAVDLPNDAAHVSCLTNGQNRIFGNILRMNCPAVCAGHDVHIISIHVADDAAHIPDDVFLTAGASATHPFFYKAAVITRAGSQNVAAIVDPFLQCAFPAEIARDAAHVVRTANFIFLIGGIGDIRIHSAPDDAAYVAGHVIGIAISLSSAAAHIARIQDIRDHAAAGGAAGDASCISNIHIFLFYNILLVAFLIMRRMIKIVSRLISRSRHIPAVFCVVYLRAFHIAHDAAYIVRAGDVQPVVDQVLSITQRRIQRMAHEAAHVVAFAGDAAQIVARSAERTVIQVADQAAHIVVFSDMLLFFSGHCPRIDEAGKRRTGRSRLLRTAAVNIIAAVANDSAYIRAACHGGAVHDIIYVRIAEHCAREAAHDIAACDSAADEGDVIDLRLMKHAKKTNIDGICPVDIQIKNIIAKTVEIPMETIFTVFDNHLSSAVNADGLKSCAVIPFLCGGGVDAVAEGVIASQIGIDSLELLHVFHPHVRVEIGNFLSFFIYCCQRGSGNLFPLISSFIVSLIVCIIADDHVGGVVRMDGNFVLRKLRVPIHLFQPFRVDDDAAAVEGNAPRIDIAEAHEDGISGCTLLNEGCHVFRCSHIFFNKIIQIPIRHIEAAHVDLGEVADFHAGGIDDVDIPVFCVNISVNLGHAALIGHIVQRIKLSTALFIEIDGSICPYIEAFPFNDRINISLGNIHPIRSLIGNDIFIYASCYKTSARRKRIIGYGTIRSQCGGRGEAERGSGEEAREDALFQVVSIFHRFSSVFSSIRTFCISGTIRGRRGLPVR